MVGYGGYPLQWQARNALLRLAAYLADGVHGAHKSMLGQPCGKQRFRITAGPLLCLFFTKTKQQQLTNIDSDNIIKHIEFVLLHSYI